VYVGRKAKEYILNYNGDQPWFCQVGFTGPHEPWDAPEPYASMYDPAQMPVPIKRDSFQDSPNRPKGNLDKLMAETTDHSPPLTEEDIFMMRANYAGNMTLIDEQIGGIIQALKDKNIYDQTVILFTSDHGEMNGDYGLIYKENFFYGAVKIPLIIRTPEIQNSERKGSICEEMVELLDLGTTMIEMSGGRIDYQQFGKSLVGILENRHLTHREEAVSEHKGEMMLATKEWKIVFNKQGEPYLLFHLTEDPNELLNVIGDPQYADVVAEFKNRLIKRCSRARSFSSTISRMRSELNICYRIMKGSIHEELQESKPSLMGVDSLKAAVLQGVGQINVMEWPERQLGAGEVRIRVKCCGICGTDQHIYHGQPGSAAFSPPIVLGHELSGEVVACGSDVTALQLGDWLSVDPNMYCGSCEYCQTG
jgi:hypothetical protein